MLGKPTIYNKNNNMYFLEIISNIIKKTELKLKKGGRDRMYLLITKGRLRSVCVIVILAYWGEKEET